MRTDEARARDIGEIVYNYLNHESTASLEQRHLEKLTQVCRLTIQESGSEVLIKAILTALLYSAEKLTKQLQNLSKFIARLKLHNYELILQRMKKNQAAP